jgi:hypothetical protein
VELANEGRTAIISLPGASGSYRLYLYGSDGKGNVYTASQGFKVR